MRRHEAQHAGNSRTGEGDKWDRIGLEEHRGDAFQLNVAAETLPKHHRVSECHARCKAQRTQHQGTADQLVTQIEP